MKVQKHSSGMLCLFAGSQIVEGFNNGANSFRVIRQNDFEKVSVSPLKATMIDMEPNTLTVDAPSKDGLVSVDVDEIVPTTAENYVAQPKKTYLDDGFVFGLEGSGLERPKGKVASLVVEGDTTKTQPYQVAMVTGTFLTHGFFASTSIIQILERNGYDIVSTLAQVCSLVTLSWVMADFGSGVLHWSVDNYGNGKTPIMGNIIAAFQGHHSAPWTITERGFCNNIYKLCIPFGIIPMVLINALNGPMVTLFFTVFCVTEILSQEFHKWSHMTKGECSPWINTLQSLGLTIGRKAHSQHHVAPYDGNYCIISGICNDILDKSGFFRRLEHIVYNWNGVESNAWKLDADLKARTLRGDYSLDI